MSKALSKHANNRVGLYQLIDYFEKSPVSKGNYARIAKQYLRFTLDNALLINQFSIDKFVENRSPVYRTACKKFLEFSQNRQVSEVYDDTRPSYKGNHIVLAFLGDAQLGESSKETYAKAINEYHKFLDSKDRGASRQSLLLFIDKLKKEDVSPHTINNYLSAIRRYLSYCIEKKDRLGITNDELEQIEDMLSVKNLKIDGTKFQKESLTEEERAHLIDCIENPRDKAVIALMAYQGLRSVELVRLRWQDIKEHKGKTFLTVLGKGRNEREWIPMLPACHKILIAYQVSITRPEGDMFGFNDTSTIRKITNKWLEVAGLKREGVSAHSLRHTAAQILMQKGVPKAMIQRFLRHKSESTTSIYTARQEDMDFLNFDFEN